jgi:DNA-binding MarR family transcriptional regulator
MPPSRSDLVSTLSARVKLECAGGGLRRASRAISRFYEAAFAPLDLTATQFSLLVAVNLGGPIPLSRLAEALVLDRTSLYRAVKPLVRRRCLRILPGRTGRERTAALTEAGRQLLHEALPIWKRAQERFVDALGPQAWTALTSGLREVVPTVQALESGTSPAGSSPTHLRAGRR